MKEMKWAGIVLIAKLVFSLTFTSAQLPIEIEFNKTQGDSCGPYHHCRMDAGLICTDGVCVCSSGRISDKYTYELAWVPSAGRCLSRENSVCIGTPETPAAPLKRIECLGAEEGRVQCTQLAGLPPGVGVCAPPAQPLHLHGQPCSETQHCDPTAGLLCSDNVCSCARGQLTDVYSYDLRWDSERGRCIGNVGSACVGTRDTPLSTLSKRIECVKDNGCVSVGPARRCTLSDVSCQQIQGLPSGIGSCKESVDQGDSSSTTTPAATTPAASSSTAPGSTQPAETTTPSAADKTAVSAFLVLLALSVLCRSPSSL